MPERFWSDNFDMDLIKIFPDLASRLGAAADIPMWTHAGTSYGRLNHPSVWGGQWGLEAFFGLRPGETGKRRGYRTDHPIVECTWLEALRDAWPHTYMIIVDGRWAVWDTGRLESTFTKIMYGLRGITTLAPGEADKLRGQVLASILAATRDLTALVDGTVTDA